MTHIAKSVSFDTLLLLSDSPVAPLKKSLRYDCIPPKFMKSLFTAEQIEDLKKEFVEVYINDMNIEQLKDWIRVVYLGELNKCTEDEIREEIDRYDENLYEVLAPYVLDMEGSYEELQEFIHERHSLDWVNN